MPSIFQVSSADYSGGKVLLSERRGFSVERHFFYQILGYCLKDFADLGGRTFELGQGEIREDESVQPCPESIEELGGVRFEFLIETTSDH